jgi:hypothetical protein
MLPPRATSNRGGEQWRRRTSRSSPERLATTPQRDEGSCGPRQGGRCANDAREQPTRLRLARRRIMSAILASLPLLEDAPTMMARMSRHTCRSYGGETNRRTCGSAPVWLSSPSYPWHRRMQMSAARWLLRIPTLTLRAPNKTASLREQSATTAAPEVELRSRKEKTCLTQPRAWSPSEAACGPSRRGSASYHGSRFPSDACQWLR